LSVRSYPSGIAYSFLRRHNVIYISKKRIGRIYVITADVYFVYRVSSRIGAE